MKSDKVAKFICGAIVFGVGMYCIITNRQFDTVQMVFYTVFATGFFVNGDFYKGRYKENG